MTNHRQLHFNAFLMSCGHHEAAWRLKDSNPFANLDLGHWTKLAHLAERGTFDSVFLADAPALWGNAAYRSSSAGSAAVAGTEPSPAPPSRWPTPSRSGRTPRPPTDST